MLLHKKRDGDIILKLSLFLQTPSLLDDLDLGTSTGLVTAILKDEKGKEHLEKLYCHIGKLYSKMNLQVDIREQEKMMSISEKLGFRVAYLNAGDLTCNIVGFERKSGDLFPSVYSSRIFQQLHEIKENYQFSYLIISRSFDDVISDALVSGISTKNVMCTLASFVLAGFPPIFIGSNMACADLAQEVMIKASDGKNRLGYENYTPVRRKATIGERALSILSSFPKVGEKKAGALMGWFNNLKDAQESFYWISVLDDESVFAMGLSSIDNSTCEECIKIMEGMEG